MKTKKALHVLSWVFLVLMLVLIYLPLLLIIVYSFIDAQSVGDSGNFTFMLYIRLFKNEELMEATLNTIVIGLVSSALATVLGTLTSIGIYYLKRGKKIVNAVTQITVVNAEIVTAVAFFLLNLFIRETIGIPIQKGVGWLIIAHTMITTPYVILTVSPRMNQLDPNLFEAGQDLGATPLRTLVTVIVPQLVKGMISGFALSFTLSLDDFVVTKMNKGWDGVSTISTYVFDNIKRNLDPAVRALSTIIFVVVLVVLIVFNVISNRKKKKIG